jgi:large subunit ribosomal protein L23
MATKKVKTEAADPKKVAAHTLILGPRVTEKAAALSEKSVYTLNVARTATKSEIAKAMKMLYNVTPIKIAISITPRKEVFSRGNWGKKGGGKKAIVTLKKGDKIAFM